MTFSADGLRGYLTGDAGLTGAGADALVLMLGEGAVVSMTVNAATDGPVLNVRRGHDSVVTAAEG